MTTTVPPRLFPQSESPSLEDFTALCSRTTDPATYPLAASIQNNIPIYDASGPAPTDDATTASRLQDEWHHILASGPGAFVLKGMYSPAVVDAATAAFDRIIAREREQASTSNKGDHFAAGGANDRIWNSFGKHALEDPESFVTYYSNPWLALVCAAWLGPGYRVTAQVNVVRPGGTAQSPHRDYHLGFQENAVSARFPRTAHVASQFLTLQGAVAHSDMPLASGPTRLLPFSQMFEPGFLAWRRTEFREFFQQRYVALPLEKGDGIFFNPALFHAAGANETADLRRAANLIQVSSAMGKTMESIDSVPLVERCWDVLRRRYSEEGLGARVEAFVRAVADGYSFPTNLDKRPPAPSGMAPETEQDVLLRGLKEGWDTEGVVQALRQLRQDSAA